MNKMKVGFNDTAFYLMCVYLSVLSTEDLDAVLETHQHMQDKLAEDMISMAKSLKNNSLIAKDIIRGDTKVRVSMTSRNVSNCYCIFADIN